MLDYKSVVASFLSLLYVVNQGLIVLKSWSMGS